MRIGLNLANEPFRRNRPMLIGLTAGLVLLLFSLLAFTVMAFQSRGVIRRDEAVANRLARQLAQLKAERGRYDAEVRRPENSEALERSVFLNQLILRKGISWTRIFADLERTLPANVRITQIRPQVNGSNQIFLEMTVAADSPEAIIAFLSKLEQSDVFGSANVTTSQAPSQTDPLYRSRLSVNYAQKL